jgi:signal transduction histidine kinase
MDARMAPEVTLADLTEAVAHELNNCLNSIMLHLATLEHGGGATATDLSVATRAIRLKSMQAGQMVNKLLQFNQRCDLPRQSLDLDSVVKKTTAKVQGGTEPRRNGRGLKTAAKVRTVTAHRAGIVLDLAGDLPPALANQTDLQRLLELLLEQAILANGQVGGPVTVRTRQGGTFLELRIADVGPAVPAEQLNQLFEPFVFLRPGDDGVRLAVCKSLARRLQGRLYGENRSAGGMEFTLALPAAEGAVCDIVG